MLSLKKTNLEESLLNTVLYTDLSVTTRDGKCKCKIKIADYSPESIPDLKPVSTALGVFYLSNTTEILNHFSTSPYIENSDADWVLDLYNRCVFYDIRTFFGYIRVLEHDDKPTDGYVLTLHVTTNDNTVMGFLVLSKEQLLKILSGVKWDNNNQGINRDFRFHFGWTVSVFQVKRTELINSLSIDAIIVPDKGVLTTPEHHQLDINNLHFEGKYLLTKDRDIFFEVKSTAVGVNATSDITTAIHMNHDQDVKEKMMNKQEIDSLEIELSIKCGDLKLSIAELEKLNIGSFLQITSNPNYQAYLYHRETLIAKGELVDVDGYLGLQITEFNKFFRNGEHDA